MLTIKAGLLKTMLTVFKHNTKAVTFFKEVLANIPSLMKKVIFRVSNIVWMRLHLWTQFRSYRIHIQFSMVCNH